MGIVCVACLGAAAVLGYFFDVPGLAAWTTGPMSMKVNTACGLIAAAAALWLVHACASESMWVRVARGLAVLVAAIGVLTLAEDLFKIDLGIDQLILPDTAPQRYTSHVGRMSPGTAFDLTIIGLALLGLKARNLRLAACPHWLVVPALLVATLAVIGHAYGVSTLYEVRSNTSMAAPTAVAFLVLGLCVLAADSAHGFAGIKATSDTAGGLVSRRLLPMIPVVLFVLGWLRLQGQIHGFYDTQFGTALLVLASIIVCIVAVATTANTLHKTDLTRQRAEAEILSLNVGLELRVQDRTRQLAQVSSQLGVVNRSLEELSRRDGLTGLANRRFFDIFLADQMRIARRHKRTLALMLCDVDSFKEYNDHYGHPAGDECLKRVADALTSCCRPGDLAARYGGEEFALILPDTELGAALIIAEAARAAVAQLEIAHATSITASYVSISGGVAVLSRTRDISPQQLISEADLNLFQAKHMGRNQMVAVHAKVA